jgi:hypothetical protein
MRGSAAYVVLWLYILNLGIAFGAGLYESRITVPQWLSRTPEGGYRWNPAAAAEADVGLRFWSFVTTIPLTLLTLASLVLLWGAPEPARRWWLISVVAALVDRALTFLYFIPTMIRLMRGDVRPESVAVAKARQWVRLGYVRHAATLIAWLAALQAFALIQRYGGVR